MGDGYRFSRKCEHVPDVFFFCIILYVCTFCMAVTFRQMKSSSFLPKPVRILMSNFGIVFTIFVMVSVDYYVGLDTPKLHVPSTFHVYISKYLTIIKVEFQP
jgi:hypothetical protein